MTASLDSTGQDRGRKTRSPTTATGPGGRPTAPGRPADERRGGRAKQRVERAARHTVVQRARVARVALGSIADCAVVDYDRACDTSYIKSANYHPPLLSICCIASHSRCQSLGYDMIGERHATE